MTSLPSLDPGAGRARIASLRNWLQSWWPGRLGRVLPAKPPACVLLVRLDRIGDHVIFSAFLEKLRAAWPATRLILAAAPDIEPLYRHCPALDAFLPFTPTREGRRLFYTQVRRLGPDWIVNPMLSRSLNSDRIVRYCHARVRLGLHATAPGAAHERARSFDRFYTHLLPCPNYSAGRPEREWHRDLLRHLGIATSDYVPRMWIGPDDDAFARDVYARHAFPPAETLVCFFRASNRLKAFPRLRPFLGRLLAETPWNVITIGDASDRDLAEPPDERLRPRWLNLCGRTTLLQTAALMRAARLVIGVDSGPAHIAAAVNVPHVIVLNGSYFGRFLPANPKSSILCHPLECYLCEDRCKFDRPYCVTEISYAIFHAAVTDALAGPHPRARLYRAAQPQLFTSIMDGRLASSFGDADWARALDAEIVNVPIPARAQL